MPLSLPRPSALLDFAISTAGKTAGKAAGKAVSTAGKAVSTAGKAVSTATAVASTPARLLRLVDSSELLLARVATMVDAAQRTLEDAQAVTASAALIAQEAVHITQEAARITQEAAHASAAAGTLVAQAAETGRTANDLITAYEPAARRFVEHLSAEEVDAAIRMIDELPRLAEHLNADIMPILATLDRVGPDIHELLGVTRDLRQAIVGIPGFAMLRRRGEDQEQGRASDR
jgi:ABC-type transporter Mla subunit MlaD